MHQKNKHSKPYAFQICMKCYCTEVYYARQTDTTVMMRCSDNDHYIKWATKEEYEGQLIIDERKRKPLF